MDRVGNPHAKPYASIRQGPPIHAPPSLPPNDGPARRPTSPVAASAMAHRAWLGSVVLGAGGRAVVCSPAFARDGADSAFALVAVAVAAAGAAGGTAGGTAGGRPFAWDVPGAVAPPGGAAVAPGGLAAFPVAIRAARAGSIVSATMSAVASARDRHDGATSVRAPSSPSRNVVSSTCHCPSAS